MSKWHKRYLEMCDLVASWSKDPSSKFGAVITDKNDRVVSLGFNGFAQGFEDTPERWNDRQFKYRHVLHAEEQAILFAKRDLSNCKLYIQMPPCSSCMSKIAQSGIKTVICKAPSEDYLSRWSIDEPMQVARECGIEVIILD